MNARYVFRNSRIPTMNRMLSLARNVKKTRKTRKGHKVKIYTELCSLKELVTKQLVEEALNQHRGGQITRKHAFIFRHYVRDLDHADPDNLEARQKFIFDALTSSEILVEDSYKITGGGKIHTIKQDKSRPRIEVFIVDYDLVDFTDRLIKKMF